MVESWWSGAGVVVEKFKTRAFYQIFRRGLKRSARELKMIEAMIEESP